MPRILIIDDEECILETLGEFSELLGYEPTLVDDPSLRLPCIDKQECPNEHPCADVLLVDQYLPTMFGLNFTEKLNRRGCKIPEGSKAIITGFLSSQETERANNLGFDVLLKPVTFEKLKNWLNTIESNAAQFL
jgi:CheY-like chemotaxis protein